ncbi:hypothetical protein NVP2275O_195 [Vibrio phage 2.275.O._10N.286.54.E11]|nr:hypothetical protein NVP2275O_195 [Vibrio phage 2.275.O._10N.286.54.E11]
MTPEFVLRCLLYFNDGYRCYMVTPAGMPKDVEAFFLSRSGNNDADDILINYCVDSCNSFYVSLSGTEYDDGFKILGEKHSTYTEFYPRLYKWFHELPDEDQVTLTLLGASL